MSGEGVADDVVINVCGQGEASDVVMNGWGHEVLLMTGGVESVVNVVEVTGWVYEGLLQLSWLQHTMLYATPRLWSWGAKLQRVEFCGKYAWMKLPFATVWHG